MSFEPYAAPAFSRDARPAVILWFRIYAASMTLLSVALLAATLLSKMGDRNAGASTVLSLAAIALVLAAVYGVATFVPFKPWGWTWGLVAIALGVASGGALFAVPLLVFWFKPQVKAAFARL
jgi:hypothetical protein